MKKYSVGISLLLCFLLLCGCRAAEPITSVDDSVKTTMQTTTQPQTQGTRKGKKLFFTDVQAYTQTVSTVKTIEDINKIFENTVGYPKQIKESAFEVPLKKGFFLVPSFKEGTVEKITLDAGGWSDFDVRLSNGELWQIVVYHRRTDLDYEEGEWLETEEGVQMLYRYFDYGYRHWYYAMIEDIRINIHATTQSPENIHSYVKNCAFEKVEIKQ